MQVMEAIESRRSIRNYLQKPVEAEKLHKVLEAGRKAPSARNRQEWKLIAVTAPDGTIVTGKTSSLLGASSAVLLNALKALGGIDHKIMLIAPTVIGPIQDLKTHHLGNHNPRLHTDEILIALSICATMNPREAVEQAARAARCHEFILSLPDGYRTRGFIRSERNCSLENHFCRINS